MKAYKLQKARAYIKRYGVKKLLYKVMERWSTDSDYNNIRKNEVATAEILEHQQKTMFKDAPVISIIMPTLSVRMLVYSTQMNTAHLQRFIRMRMKCLFVYTDIAVMKIQ